MEVNLSEEILGKDKLTTPCQTNTVYLPSIISDVTNNKNDL